MTKGHSNPDDRAEANDPVWRLLGQVPPPEPDAWFTVRTLARCRHEGATPEPRGWLALSRFWRWTLGTGLGVSLAVVLLARTHTETPAPVDQPNVQEAFEVLASFGPDPDSSNNSSSWQDTSY
jgi:hypothetical protein